VYKQDKIARVSLPRLEPTKQVLREVIKKTKETEVSMENIITCFTPALLLELHKWSIDSCMAAAHLQQSLKQRRLEMT
jgi:hypothetical protein